MIDLDKTVVNRIMEKVSPSRVSVGYLGGLGRVAQKNAFMIRYPQDEEPIDFEVGVISNPIGMRQRLDLRNAAYYMTDYRATMITHILVDSALGRLVQVSTGGISHAGGGRTPGIIQPLTSIETSEGYDAVKDMHDMITGRISDVTAPMPILAKRHLPQTPPPSFTPGQ